MSGLNVFVSSTCADLVEQRAQLRNLILDMGYNPIMSDHGEVLYDPDNHTHSSCINAVSDSDIFVLLIGSRFGGAAQEEALTLLDFDTLFGQSKKGNLLSEKSGISITMAETLRAVQLEIPIYTLIDAGVYSDHYMYTKNKSNESINKITFPHIEKNESAISIFNFIDFLRHRSTGNGIQQFSNFSDISNFLKQQWSRWFRSLIKSRQNGSERDKGFDLLSEKIDGLNSAILQISTSSPDTKTLAKNIFKFHRLIEILLFFSQAGNYVDIFDNGKSIYKILRGYGWIDVALVQKPSEFSIVFIWPDKFIGYTGSVDVFNQLEGLWKEFSALEIESRRSVVEAIRESSSGPAGFRLIDSSVEEYTSSRHPDGLPIKLALSSKLKNKNDGDSE